MKKIITTLSAIAISICCFGQNSSDTSGHTQKKPGKEPTHARSAKTGQYVTKENAAKHPSTTVVEHPRKSENKKPK